MAVFQVQVTRFDPNCNQWTPLCQGPCLARVVASTHSIILSDVAMNHIKTINLSSGFDFQQQQIKHYIVMTAVTTYGFVLPDPVAGRSFQVAVQGLLDEQQQQVPASPPHAQALQQSQQHQQPNPCQYPEEQHFQEGRRTLNHVGFPPTPPPIPPRRFHQNQSPPLDYGGNGGFAPAGARAALYGNPFQTAPLPRGAGGVPQGSGGVPEAAIPGMYGQEQWQPMPNQQQMYNPFRSYRPGRNVSGQNNDMARNQKAHSFDELPLQPQQHPYGEQHSSVTRRQTAPALRNANQQQWSCPACTFLNQPKSDKCRMCGTKNPNDVLVVNEAVPREAREEFYDCAQCSLRNRATALRCEVCDTPNPDPWIVIPDVGAQAAPAARDEAAAVAVEVNDDWFCRACTSRNEVTSVNCIVCLTPGPKRLAVDEEAEEANWTCGACTLKNYPTVKKCTACNGNRPADYVVPPDYQVKDEERQILDAEKLNLEMKKMQLTQIFSIFGIHLLPNPEPFVCPLCQTDVEKGLGVALFQCFHFFCKICLIALIKASDGLYVMCPYRDAVVCDSYLKMHEIKQLLSKDELKTYLEKNSAAARLSDVTFHCRTADCSGWCFAADVDGKFVCPLCEVETCVICRFSHVNMSCEQYNNLVQEIPEEWVNDGQFQDQVLHPLGNETAEWRQVEEFFNSNLQTQCQVVKIERCQNKDLWRKYAWQKKLMAERNGEVNVNEKLLFHGTRQNDPAEIWRGNEGFDLRHCQNGAWGRGSYFAENSQYSSGYAFVLEGKRRQIFVAKVLTGFTCEMPADNTLTRPPLRLTRPDGVKVLHDSVSGTGGGSKIFIVYQLDVAYPAYLITYDLQQ